MISCIKVTRNRHHIVNNPYMWVFLRHFWYWSPTRDISRKLLPGIWGSPWPRLDHYCQGHAAMENTRKGGAIRPRPFFRL